MEILSKEVESIALKISQFESRHTNNIFWTFLHAQVINVPVWRTRSKFVPPEKQWKKVTVSLEPDRRFQKCCFREGRIGILR